MYLPAYPELSEAQKVMVFMNGACNAKVLRMWLHYSTTQLTTAPTYADVKAYLLSLYSSSDYRVTRVMALMNYQQPPHLSLHDYVSAHLSLEADVGDDVNDFTVSLLLIRGLNDSRLRDAVLSDAHDATRVLDPTNTRKLILHHATSLGMDYQRAPGKPRSAVAPSTNTTSQTAGHQPKKFQRWNKEKEQIFAALANMQATLAATSLSPPHQPRNCNTGPSSSRSGPDFARLSNKSAGPPDANNVNWCDKCHVTQSCRKPPGNGQGQQ